MKAFWIAFVIVFVAEMGDKTQFMTLSFATRYRTTAVVIGVLTATLLISFISVLLGQALGSALPMFWIDLFAGLLFIGFGLWSLRGGEEEEVRAKGHFGPILTIALGFFLAELGDRTMIATVLVAGQQQSFVGVWFGSALGLTLANAIGLAIGKLLGKHLPEKVLRLGTVLIFVASGIVMLYEAWKIS